MQAQQVKESTPVPASLGRIPHFSFNLVRSMERCEYQTLEVRVQKSVKEDEGEALRNGKVVHKIIEDHLKDGVPIPESHGYLSKHVEPFAHVAQNQDIRVYIEHEMAINRRLRVCKWFDKDTWGRARTDFLAIQGDLALAADWKTGKLDPEAIEQLKLNAVFIFWHFPEVRRISLSAVWLTGDHKPTSLWTSRDQLPVLWGEFQHRLGPLARAFETNEWRKVPGPYCRWCPVIRCSLHPAKLS